MYFFIQLIREDTWEIAISYKPLKSGTFLFTWYCWTDDQRKLIIDIWKNILKSLKIFFTVHSKYHLTKTQYQLWFLLHISIISFQETSTCFQFTSVHCLMEKSQKQTKNTLKYDQENSSTEGFLLLLSSNSG